MSTEDLSKSPKDGHLVVLVHGLWGTHKHVDVIGASIQHAFSEVSDSEICLLQPKSSTYFKTYDGVKVIGNRFLKEVYLEIEILKRDSNIKVTKFSIIGYSLGGLISRYMIGELYQVGFFDDVTPFFFTTFATPHLGVKFFTNPLSPILNFLGSNLIGRSGKDLFIKSEILVKLGDPESVYFKALELFKQRYLLCNVRHDRTVAFYTSFITNVSPFENWDRVKLHFFNGIPEIKVGGESIKPKIIDLKRTEFRSKDDPVRKPTFQGRMRYLGILILIGLIIPFWFPVVLTANCIGSVLSLVRLTFSDTSIDNKEEWAHVRELLNEIDGDQLHPLERNESESQLLHRTKSNQSGTSEIYRTRASDSSNGFSKELAGMTEGAIEGMLEAPNRNEDLDSKDKTDSLESSAHVSANVSSASLANAVSKIKAGGFNDAIFIDFKKHATAINRFLSLIDSKKNNEFEYPVFNNDEVEPLPFDPVRESSNEVLNSLQWFKIPVYIDTFNAHDGIVSRRGLKSTARGFATIYFWAVLLREQLAELESA